MDNLYSDNNSSSVLTSGVASLTKQLIEIEKQKLLNSGKDKLKDLIGGVLNKKTSDSIQVDNLPKKDSTKSKTEETVKSLLKGLIKNRKKKKDAIN